MKTTVQEKQDLKYLYYNSSLRGIMSWATCETHYYRTRNNPEYRGMLIKDKIFNSYNKEKELMES